MIIVLQDPWRKEPNPFPAQRTADLRSRTFLFAWSSGG